MMPIYWHLRRALFDLIHAEFIREIEPGEVLIIDENGIALRKAIPGRAASVLHV